MSNRMKRYHKRQLAEATRYANQGRAKIVPLVALVGQDRFLAGFAARIISRSNKR